MTEAKKEEQFSLDKALGKLKEMLKIVTKDSESYYLKSAQEIDSKLLKDLDISFMALSALSIEFLDQWYNSRYKGPDAIQSSEKLNIRIDIKLFETGKLDFDQMKKIMIRLNRIDDALTGLDKIKFYATHYKNICREKKLEDQVSHAEMFIESIIETAMSSVSTEGKRLKNQVER